MGCGFMYESVFAFNGVFQTLIPVIGTDMTWSADGRTLTINLDPTAKWSDGSSITPEDVKYSFELAAAQSRWSGMDDWESITTGTNQVIFHQMANTTFSYGLFTRLTTDVPIVKKSVWTDICRYANNETAPAGGVFDLKARGGLCSADEEHRKREHSVAEEGNTSGYAEALSRGQQAPSVPVTFP
jgi:ABC-type transport system substrate-binding protein